MRCAFVLYFFFLVFCCGLSANAEKIRGSQTFSTTSQVKYQGHNDAPEIIIEIITNQALTSSFSPVATVYFKDHFLTTVIVSGSGIFVRRLLPDLQAIVKCIIFPQHFFW
ncbi:hypothetical protein GO495_17055 [Chitinophaga oryziterrae]|uniref:Uncharacterized protein n=1 Tax=Chitinophaga oryziterrae TaxID=1031224 RepID=A0A6N8JAW8_9BACT|nr:hypothetical protein [Chitinophaga oryziterrae]MVT42303.1 hypothetical protein [Chitinophaga oryziterrae]